MLPVCFTSSIFRDISASWSFIIVSDLTSLIYGYLFKFLIDLSKIYLFKYWPGSIEIFDLIVLFFVIEFPLISILLIIIGSLSFSKSAKSKPTSLSIISKSINLLCILFETNISLNNST